MSFLNKGGSSKANTSTENINTSSNTNLQDTGDGVNVAAAGNSRVTVNMADTGLVDLAKTTYQQALDNILSFGTEALDFSDKANADSRQGFNRSFDFASDTIDQALNFVESSASRDSNIVDRALDFVNDSAVRQTGLVGSTVKALNDISTQNNTSSDQRIQQVSETAVKAVLIIGGLLTLVGVVYLFTRKKS